MSQVEKRDRPAKPSVQVYARLSADLYDKLTRIQRTEKCTESEIIAILLTEAIEQRLSGLPVHACTQTGAVTYPTMEE